MDQEAEMFSARCYTEFHKPQADLAVCLSGFMRTFKVTVHSYEKFLFRDVEADVYVATWDIAGNRHWKCSNGREPEETVTPEAIKEVYGDRVKGIAITPYDLDPIQPPWIDEIPPKWSEAVKRIISMWYHIWMTRQLRQHVEELYGHRYRAVMRLRPDISLIHEIGGHVRGDLKAGTAYTSPVENYGIVNDQFMFGLPETLDLIWDIYRHIMERTPEIIPRSECPVCPAEGLLLKALKYHGITVEELPIAYHRHMYYTNVV